MVQRESLPEGVTRFKTAMGEGLYSNPAPSVVLVRYKGHVEEALYEPINHEIVALLQRHPKVTLFSDFAEVGSYDTDFRTHWTEWFKSNRARLGGVLILQKSALVKMGIRLVNLVAGEVITPFTDAAEFEQRLEQAIRAER